MELFLIVYVIIGLLVARKEYNNERDYLEAIEDMYPPAVVVFAIITSTIIITITWPYTLYLMWRDS